MDAQVTHIITELASGDSERFRKASAKLNNALENQEAVLALCRVVESGRTVHMRQYAAILLGKRLRELRYWQLVPAEQKEKIKTGMLKVLLAEKEKVVLNSIAQLVGFLLQHEDDKKTLLTELLNFIYSRCGMDDPKESELGSSIFAKLTQTAPDQFVSHLGEICELFGNVLTAAEAKRNMTTQTVANLISGMSFLMHVIGGHTLAEQTIAKAFPVLVKIVFSFAQKVDENEFSTVFEIIDNISEYVPRVLKNNMKHLIDCCLQTASNTQINDAIRVQVIAFVGQVLPKKKKAIAKLNLLEPILTCTFEIICSDTEVNDDLLFSTESYNTPASAAAQTLDVLAMHMSSDKLMPPLLQLLEPALRNPNPMRRRAAFICIANATEGCSEVICSKYLDVMITIVNTGIADNSPAVQSASFYALGQFSEFLQPDISKFAPQILPILCDYLQRSLKELESGQPEPSHIDRVFYALESFCENLEKDIVPYLPLLMSRLFDISESCKSVHVRGLALNTISATILSAKDDVLPYLAKIGEILTKYLVKDCSEEMKELRNDATDALASLFCAVGKENCVSLANNTMAYCFTVLNDNPNDPELKRAIYNLLGGLSNVVNESMSIVFPNILDGILKSVISTADIRQREVPGSNPLFDLNTDTESKDDDYEVINDYLFEKDEAILTLKKFAVNTGSAFAQYLPISFENVYKVIDHPNENIRKSSTDAICAFIKSLHKMGNSGYVKHACEIVMPKFASMIRNDNDQGVVIHLLELLNDLFRCVKHDSVPSPKISDLIFRSIKDVLNKKVDCQLNDADGADDNDSYDSELDEFLIKCAVDLLPAFGKVLTPETYSTYFSRVYHHILKQLNKGKKEQLPEMRSFAYGVLAESIKSLDKYVSTYFNTLYPIFIEGIKDHDSEARHNSYFGLGELVLYSGEKSFTSFQQILQALSVAIASEKNGLALDNICGAVCRLILANFSLVPLAHVLPVLLSHLPLREDMDENEIVFKAFLVLFMHARPIISGHIEQILRFTTAAWYKNQIPDGEGKRSAHTLIMLIRSNYPNQFNNVANSTQNTYHFLRSL